MSLDKGPTCTYGRACVGISGICDWIASHGSWPAPAQHYWRNHAVSRFSITLLYLIMPISLIYHADNDIIIPYNIYGSDNIIMICEEICDRWVIQQFIAALRCTAWLLLLLIIRYSSIFIIHIHIYIYQHDQQRWVWYGMVWWSTMWFFVCKRRPQPYSSNIKPRTPHDHIYHIISIVIIILYIYMHMYNMIIIIDIMIYHMVWMSQWAWYIITLQSIHSIVIRHVMSCVYHAYVYDVWESLIVHHSYIYLCMYVYMNEC